MKAGKPWSLSHVDDETREAIVRAAQQSGLSVSEWLGQPAEDDSPVGEGERAFGPADHEDNDSEALAGAIARLSERLGSMDERTRAAVGNLKGRLGEIERRLGRIADSRQDERERVAALADVTAVVEALIRDLDNVDEHARSTVEGLDARPAHAPPPHGPSQQASASTDSAPPQSRPPESPQLEQIRTRLDELLNGPSSSATEPPSRTAATEAALQALEARIDEARARLVAAREAHPPMQQSSAADQIERIEARLDEIAARLPARKDADLAAAVREISTHQRAIDDRAETLAMRRDQKALAAAMAALRADIMSLTDRVAVMARFGGEDQDAVFELARRIDALAAERPLDRGLVEQLRGEFDAMRKAIAEGGDPAIRRLETRTDEIAARLEQLADKAPDLSRVEELAEEVAALRRGIEASESAAAVARLEARVGELSRSLETAMSGRPLSSGDTSAIARRLDEIAAGLADLGERPPASEGAATIATLEGAVAEIAANVGRLLERPSPAAASPTVAALESRLGEMSAAISALVERPSVDGGGEIARLEQRLSEMAANIGSQLAGSGGLPDITRLESRLDDIVESINGLFATSPAAVDVDIGRLEERLDGIAASMQSLSDRAPPIGEAERLHERLQALAGRIDSLNLPETDLEADLDDIKSEVASLRAIHQRLQTLTERIESLSATQHQPLLAIAEIKDGISAIRALHERMQTLTDRIDRLSAGQRDPTQAVEQFKSSFAAMHDVGEQVQALAARIDGLVATREPDHALDEMQSGVAAIKAVGEQLQTLADRIDAMAGERQPAIALDEIRQGIAAIRAEMAARGEPSSERLQDQIHDLAQRLESVARPQPEGDVLAQLEVQMAQIAKALATGEPDRIGLRRVEERIDRLQAHLADGERESIEAARNEAREAVQELSRMVAANQADSDLIGAVMQDLDTLRSSTGDSERRMRAKLGGITRTLAQVVARLGRLEQEPGRLSAEATGTYGSEPAAEWNTSTPNDHQDDDWLASPAPDEAALVDKPPVEQRADFIAAARRAVQAAAMEAGVADEDEDDGKQRQPGAFSRITRAMRGRKRTLLLAAAVVVLAIGAFHFYGRVPTGDDGNTDVAMTPDKPSASRSNEAGVPAAGEVLGQATAADVDEPALVAPTPIPDRSVTFGQPILTSHFVAAAPEAAAGGAVDATAATGSIAATPAALTIALPAPPADAGLPAPDPRIGSPKLIDAAMTGDPGAAFEVASRYAQGDRLPKNLAKAAEWYQRAAEGGVVVAQYRLASLYERGQGVAKDLAEAVNWYQHAADQGNVNAMHNLAVLMSEGVDGPPDQAKALQWFQTAAGYGVRDSQYNLGVIYARGLGVDQDLVASYKWFALAAAQGDDDAAQRRDEVADALSADDLAKARAAAAAWHAKPSLAEANAVVMPAGGWDDPGDGLAEADRQALVKKIQALLAEQGYDPGPVDGVAGPRTLQAVRQFQHKVGEPETGQIDTRLVALLNDGQS